MSMATGISLRDLLEVYGPRDIATVESILIDRMEESAPKRPVGKAVFH